MRAEIESSLAALNPKAKSAPRAGASCGILHRQQLDRCFPRRGTPAANVRLTARTALAALRWLEERPRKRKCRYVPSWAVLRFLGKHLIRSHIFVPILANRVGGGLTRDQIYSYFSMRRREPDGEFALRFLELIAELRGLDRHPQIGPLMQTHEGWICVSEILDLEVMGARKRMDRSGRLFGIEMKPARFRRRNRSMKALARTPFLIGGVLVSPVTRRLKMASPSFAAKEGLCPSLALSSREDR